METQYDKPSLHTMYHNGGQAEGEVLKKQGDGVKNRALNFSSHSVSMRPFRAVLKDF
jgi:hypothetical protein